MTNPVMWDIVTPTFARSPNLKQNCGMTNFSAGGSDSPFITNGWNAAILAIVNSVVGFHLATTGYLFIDM